MSWGPTILWCTRPTKWAISCVIVEKPAKVDGPQHRVTTEEDMMLEYDIWNLTVRRRDSPAGARKQRGDEETSLADGLMLIEWKSARK